ncbi:AAA family ATPase [Nonomuraea helvata]|uniref:AAA family ATPase n=1 Tax=Nonomuraea helvata TaxID=37484 RepID=A0ABV5RXC6_9ACTN
MRFYDFATELLRGIDDDTERHSVLGPSGEHLGHVLGALAEDAPQVKEDFDAYIRATIPQCLGIDERREGEFSAVQGRFWSGDPVLGFWQAAGTPAGAEGEPQVNVFRRQELSDGALRAAGVLAALFQPGTLDGSITLVSIENPEIAIHPAHVNALLGAMHAASGNTQVIATTQSSDLLDSEDVRTEHLRIVEMRQGASVIGELEEHTKKYVTSQKAPGPLPELHRQGQLRPADATQERSRLRLTDSRPYHLL